MDYQVELLLNEFVTHDVRRLILSRPKGFDFVPGQGVELAIDTPQWRDQGRPFTPTSLPGDGILEFTIKGYPEHHGVTEQLHQLHPGSRLLMSQPFGAIRYQGPGTFIAAGAGITPFMAILRQLAAAGKLEGHRLLFSNKSPADIICGQELHGYLGERSQLLCSRATDCNCRGGRIDFDFLRSTIDDFSQRFYVCGPPPFVNSVNAALIELGAVPDGLIFEK
jgi:cytochrome-b5 reductase